MGDTCGFRTTFAVGGAGADSGAAVLRCRRAAEVDTYANAPGAVRTIRVRRARGGIEIDVAIRCRQEHITGRWITWYRGDAVLVIAGQDLCAIAGDGALLPSSASLICYGSTSHEEAKQTM